MDREFAQIIEEAGRRAEVREAVKNVYDALGEQIEKRKPICAVSGRCCRFEEYGHRLYVTTMELAAFWWELSRNGEQLVGARLTPHPHALPQREMEKEARGCPFQKGKLCSVHPIRPFGCRIFFCDPTAQQWQNEQYEHFHARLKREHERLGVSYRYLEWRNALKKIDIAIC